MKFRPASEAVALLNEWSASKTPFLFFVDYEGKRWYAAPLDSLDPRISYRIPGREGGEAAAADVPSAKPRPPHRILPPAFEDYSRGFEIVRAAISAGETRLVNLTWRVAFESAFSQRERFRLGREKYMLMVEGLFSVFSPEPFVEIEGGRIATFPMKGTISTSIPNAAAVLLADPKEAREHADSVSLMRDDLARVADDVKVVRYRYCETIADGKIIQTSSEIAGTLKSGLRDRLGDVLHALLPGGSITGTPKAATIGVIRRAEAFPRGFYTGVFGVFDGAKLQTSVMIRFLGYGENGEKFFFGGGGVTADSTPEREYRELLLKADATVLH